MSYQDKKLLGLTLALLTVPGIALAGGPLLYTASGDPILWDVSQPVPFNPDQGSLGLLSHAEAVQFVQDAFSHWQAIPTSSISFANAGELPFDVNVNNYAPFFAAGNVCDGLSPIVLDANGAIFDDIFGTGSGVLGFAGPDCVVDTARALRITEGAAFIDGGWLDGSQANGEISVALMLYVMIHEFGHYINLSHSDVNGTLFLNETDFYGFGVPPSPSVETMFPFIFEEASVDLKFDDMQTASLFYPDPSLFGMATGLLGNVRFGSGAPASGVNVIARDISNLPDSLFFGATSQISGAFTTQPYARQLEGTYLLVGQAGHSYVIQTAEIGPGGYSSDTLIPFFSQEFYSGAAESANPLTDSPLSLAVVGGGAGQVVSGLDIILNFGGDYVSIDLNFPAYTTQDTLIARLNTQAGPPNLPMTAFAGIDTPSGRYYLQPGGGFSTAATPLASNFILPAVSGLPLFSIPIANLPPAGPIVGGDYAVFMSFETAPRGAPLAEASSPLKVYNGGLEDEPNGDIADFGSRLCLNIAGQEVCFTIAGLSDACNNGFSVPFVGIGTHSSFGPTLGYDNSSDMDCYAFNTVPGSDDYLFDVVGTNGVRATTDPDLYIWLNTSTGCSEQSITNSFNAGGVYLALCLSGDLNRETCSVGYSGLQGRSYACILPYNGGPGYVAGDYRIVVEALDGSRNRVQVPVQPVAPSAALQQIGAQTLKR